MRTLTRDEYRAAIEAGAVSLREGAGGSAPILFLSRGRAPLDAAEVRRISEVARRLGDGRTDLPRLQISDARGNAAVVLWDRSWGSPLEGGTEWERVEVEA